MMVTNDNSERAIALVSKFDAHITKDEDQKQFLLQVIEHHRQQYQDVKKSNLKTASLRTQQQ